MDDFGGIREIENIFPMIDILMGTYNGECYIEEQIESILAQTYSNWKLIIRDDGSTDRTFEIIRKYSQDYPDKIFVVDEDGNLGSCRNFASLMNLSSSDYVMFADQDDVWEKNKIELTFAKLLELEKIHGKNTPVLVHSDMTVVDKNLKVIAKSFWKMMKIFPEFESDVNKVAVRNVVTGMTIIMNRSALTVSIPIPDSAVMHDWWIAVNVAKRGVIGHITDKTVLYRQHGRNTIGCCHEPFYVSLKKHERLMVMLNDLPFHLDAEVLEKSNRYIYRKSFGIKNLKGIFLDKPKKLLLRIAKKNKTFLYKRIRMLSFKRVNYRIDNPVFIEHNRIILSGWCYCKRYPVDKIIIETASGIVSISEPDFVFRDDVCGLFGIIPLSKSGFLIQLKAEEYFNTRIKISFYSEGRKLSETFAGEKDLSREVRKCRIDRMIRTKDGFIELSGWILSCRSRLLSVRAVVRKPQRIELDNAELVVRDDVFSLGRIDSDLVRGFRFRFCNFNHSDAEIEIFMEFENKGKFRLNYGLTVFESDEVSNLNDSLKLLDYNVESIEKTDFPRIDVVIPGYSGSAKKNVAILSHIIGGGADVYKENRIAGFISEGINVVDIQYDVYNQRYKLSVVSQKDKRSYYFNDFSDFKHLCRLLNISEIYINNLVTFPDVSKILTTLKEVRSHQEIRVSVLIHDYFMICPSYVLLNKEGNFCGIPDIDECRKCISKHSFTYLPVRWADIDDWRSTWSSLLSISDEMICFSKSSEKLLLRAYPGIKQDRISVNPHKVNFIRKALPEKKDKTLNIGILGTITYPKGLRIIEEMLVHIDNKYLNVCIKVIGTMPVQISSRHLNVSGKYEHNDLVDLIEKNSIDIIFIPSVWPETFSYTTEEAIQTGLPVAVFDLGAPAERVRAYDKGLIVSKINALTALDEITAFMMKRNQG